MGGFIGRRMAAVTGVVIAGAAALSGITSTTAGAAAISGPSAGGVRRLTVLDSTGSVWRTPVVNAVADWDAAPQLALAIQSGSTDTATGTCAATPGTIRICARNYSPNITKKSAHPGVDVRQNKDATGRVVSGSVRIDTSVMSSPYTASGALSNVSTLDVIGGRRQVVCEAIGEALGLSIDGAHKSCMNVYGRVAGPGPASAYNRPSSTDYATIARLYA